MDPAEIVIITFWAFFLLLQIVATGYLLVHRNYGPFKAKQIDLIVLSVISECFWFVGALQAIKFLPQEGIWALCSLWSLWFNTTFGLFLWGGILLLRFVKIFLYEQRKFWPNWQMNLLLFTFWSPSIVLSVVGTAISDLIFSTDNACILNNSFFAALFVYAAGYIICYIVFMILLRKVKHRALNEYKGTVASVVVLVIGFFIFGVLTALNLNDEYVWARCLSFSALQALHNFNFWVLVGYPIYMSIQDREGFENYFYGRE